MRNNILTEPFDCDWCGSWEAVYIVEGQKVKCKSCKKEWVENELVQKRSD